MNTEQSKQLIEWFEKRNIKHSVTVMEADRDTSCFSRDGAAFDVIIPATKATKFEQVTAFYDRGLESRPVLTLIPREWLPLHGENFEEKIPLLKKLHTLYYGRLYTYKLDPFVIIPVHIGVNDKEPGNRRFFIEDGKPIIDNKIWFAINDKAMLYNATIANHDYLLARFDDPNFWLGQDETKAKAKNKEAQQEYDEWIARQKERETRQQERDYDADFMHRMWQEFTQNKDYKDWQSRRDPENEELRRRQRETFEREAAEERSRQERAQNERQRRQERRRQERAQNEQQDRQQWEQAQRQRRSNWRDQYSGDWYGQHSRDGYQTSGDKVAQAKKIMGVTTVGSPTELKKIYLGLTKKLHPDMFPERQKEQATKNFQELGNAYELLLMSLFGLKPKQVK
jgi:hypothetical protein